MIATDCYQTIVMFLYMEDAMLWDTALSQDVFIGVHGKEQTNINTKNTDFEVIVR